jgi:hypothetical protein
MSRLRRGPAPAHSRPVPFDTVEDVWFWFMAARSALADGAHYGRSFGGGTPRPCEPADILRLLDRLHRVRRLERDHLLVLRHYGRRGWPPDPYAPREKHAARLWGEAMNEMGPVLRAKGVVAAPEAEAEPGARRAAGV